MVSLKKKSLLPSDGFYESVIRRVLCRRVFNLLDGVNDNFDVRVLITLTQQKMLFRQ